MASRYAQTHGIDIIGVSDFEILEPNTCYDPDGFLEAVIQTTPKLIIVFNDC